MTLLTNRRTFLTGASALVGSLSMPGLSKAQARVVKKWASGKVAEGVYPIGWTICTPDNKLDKAGMVAQQKFLNRGKVAGIAWPQNASQWQTITQQEWSDGADAITSVKGGPTAVALGVQTVGFVTAKSVEYVQEAKRKGADAVVSLCNPAATWPEVIAYFQALAKASNLPIIMQCTGPITLDQMVMLAEQVPQIAAVKDEAQGSVADRAPDLIARTKGKLGDWSGSGGNNMIPEMEKGMTGTCPTAGMSDVQQQVFNLWMAGKKDEAAAVFAKYRAFTQLPHANDYVFVARGVLPETSIFRAAAPRPAAAAPAAPAAGAAPARGGAARATGPITDEQKAALRTALADPGLKPYLIGG